MEQDTTQRSIAPELVRALAVESGALVKGLTLEQFLEYCDSLAPNHATKSS